MGSHAREMDAMLMKSYEDLLRHIEGVEAAITVENFIKTAWVKDRVAFLDKISHPQVGMILDIGHVRNEERENVMTIQGGPTRVIEICRKHLRHLHLNESSNWRQIHRRESEQKSG